MLTESVSDPRRANWLTITSMSEDVCWPEEPSTSRPNWETCKPVEQNLRVASIDVSYLISSHSGAWLRVMRKRDKYSGVSLQRSLPTANFSL
ncbi:hypothetical protein AVEN_107495-1 [Araneus ventricosus]|uniref:Uncharacterized protein n=1 Tax=Araneus ventricosus TaxID=182803 RepID=A0A4Y2PQK2_ARAVE|nr:hypothetical protein AVEN_107495-1 [Araneus ventricosus]